MAVSCDAGHCILHDDPRGIYGEMAMIEEMAESNVVIEIQTRVSALRFVCKL